MQKPGRVGTPCSRSPVKQQRWAEAAHPTKSQEPRTKNASVSHDECTNSPAAQAAIQLGLKPFYAMGQRYA
jgi:hypothetical protein